MEQTGEEGSFKDGGSRSLLLSISVEEEEEEDFLAPPPPVLSTHRTNEGVVEEELLASVLGVEMDTPGEQTDDEALGTFLIKVGVVSPSVSVNETTFALAPLLAAGSFNGEEDEEDPLPLVLLMLRTAGGLFSVLGSFKFILEKYLIKGYYEY